MQSSVLVRTPHDLPPLAGWVVIVLVCLFMPLPHSALHEGPSTCQPEVTQSMGQADEPVVSQARHCWDGQPSMVCVAERH